MLGELTNSGAIPALEAMMRFAGARQRVIAGNIANFSTPNYRMRDLSVSGFQAALREAVHARRQKGGGAEGELDISSTDEVTPGPQGTLRFNPSTPDRGYLFHDRNNRDLERAAQDLVENATAYRISADLLRSRYEVLRSAISERV